MNNKPRSIYPTPGSLTVTIFPNVEKKEITLACFDVQYKTKDGSPIILSKKTIPYNPIIQKEELERIHNELGKIREELFTEAEKAIIKIKKEKTNE